MVSYSAQDGHAREVPGNELHGRVNGEQAGGVALRPHVVKGEVARHVAEEPELRLLALTRKAYLWSI